MKINLFAGKPTKASHVYETIHTCKNLKKNNKTLNILYPFQNFACKMNLGRAAQCDIEAFCTNCENGNADCPQV